MRRKQNAENVNHALSKRDSFFGENHDFFTFYSKCWRVVLDPLSGPPIKGETPDLGGGG